MRCSAVLWLVVAIALPLRAAVPSGERDALIALYNSTGGSAWTNRIGWLGASGTECTWFGVRCSDDGSAVIGIYLSQNNLSGLLPPDIGSFSSLKELELYSNAIGGAIPPQMGNLTQLQRLALYGNGLSGAIPPELGRLTQLAYLALGNNQLSGAIPPELGNLSNVEFFSFNGDLLGGPIPSELGRLLHVQTLDLSYNRIGGTIPRELSQLSTLTELDLNNNQLTGSIPPELGSLAALRVFTASINQLSGSIPSQLGRLSELRSLSLAINQLTGTIPVELANLSKLESLSLQQNALSGPIPPELSGLALLRELVLNGNQLSGTIPPELARLSNLQRLNLEQNALTGTIPRELGALANLLVLSVSDNRLSGALPHELTSLTKLISLSFSGNRIGGALPPDIDKLQDLQELVAFENQLTGTIPDGIGSLAKLRSLLLGGNQLTGTIPPSITNLSALTFLDLRGNQLTGGLPADIDRMRSLSNISLFANRLGGPIPDAITRLTGLTTLRLENNEFTGAIPPAIVGLTQLQFLGLRNNHLDGIIPAGIGRLTALQTLWLGGNRLSGSIPAEIGALTNLTWIDLANNRFSGTPPHELANLVNLTDSLSDFRYNLLSSNDTALIAFLNRKQDGGQWLATQTLPPSNVAVATVTDRSAIVSWTLASYTDDEGGYQVSVATTAGTGVTVASTASKLLTSILVRGLSASTSYLVTVRTVTHPHGLQQNTLTSDATGGVTLTTVTAVILPPSVELTSTTSGLLQRGGQPQNEDSFTLSNSGDVSTAIALTTDGAFFTISPATFALAGGASQAVRVTSLPQPSGAYSGKVTPAGSGVPADLSVPIQLLSVTAPAGTAVAAPTAARIDISGDRASNTTATSRFTNSGTATLSGIMVSDTPWIDAPQNLITIPPGASVDVPFTIVPSRRPSTDGALAGSLRLVYLNGSGTPSLSALGAIDPLADSGVSVSTVTVVFTAKPTVGSAAIPALAAGEVARFIAGVLNVANGANRVVSDVFLSNSFGVASVRDLRLFLTGMRPSAASPVAGFSQLDPSQSIQLASVVSSVYSSDVPVGTLQLRTADWDKLLVNATLADLRPNGSRNSALPVFRSDRAAAAGSQITLPGVEKGDQRRTDLFVQETSGNAASATVELLDSAGTGVGEVRSIDVPPYGLIEIDDSVSASVGTLIVTNVSGSAGQLVAYAMVSDLQGGDRWAIVDWARYAAFRSDQSVKIPLAAGNRATGRRRVAPHALGTQSAALKSDLAIFNLDSAAEVASVTFYPAAGSVVTRDLMLAPRETRMLRDVIATFFGNSNTGYLVVSPVRGHVAVSSRTYFESGAGSRGSAVAARAEASGLRLGQKQTFAGIEDSAAFRSGFGAIESAGAAAKIRATLVYQDGRSVYATLVSHDYDLAPRGVLLVDDVASSILGARRDSLSDLHNLQVTFQMIDGDGAVTLFILSADNGSGQTAVRLE